MSEDVVTRFAPSPTGDLHLGNARTALFNFLLARARGGRFVVRAEDTDAARSTAASLDAQLEDLAWLGLDWDAGPGREDGKGPYRQSERGPIYQRFLQKLLEQGKAFSCYCSPAELEVVRRSQAASGLPPRYPGTCRGLDAAACAAHEAAGRQPVLRFRVPDGGAVEFDDLVRGPQRAELATIGDFVLRRADGSAMFFFVNAVDDALMGVSAVLRGDDHLTNTPRQLLVLAALGLAAPRYGHLPLLLDQAGTPLSKRAGSGSLRRLRERGYLADAVANYLLRLGHAGAPDGWVERPQLAASFAVDRLGRAPAHFDAGQLDHWQREAVKRLSPEAARAWLGPALPAQSGNAAGDSLIELLRHNLLFPDDLAPWLRVLDGEPDPVAGEDRAVLAEAGRPFFDSALAAYEESGPDLARLSRALRGSTGRKGAALFMPLRIALTGRRDGPELGPLLAAIPARRVRERLAAAAGLG